MVLSPTRISIREKRLVFLVGAPRSGTTWLQLLLSSSPAVATVNETHLFSTYTASLFSGWKAYKSNARAIGLNPLMSEEEYLGLIRELTSEVMARILQTKPAASVILEKTPAHVHHWQDILAIFPDAYFLHIVRDPRAVIASLQAARRWGAGWISSRLVDNCETWRTSVERGRAIRGATPNYLEIRYRDLMGDGTAVLRQVFGWMGVEASEAECEKILEANRIDRLRDGRVDTTPWPLDTEPPDFYRKGQVEGWREELTPLQISVVERMTRSLLLELGYTPSTDGTVGVNRLIAAFLPMAEKLRGGLRWRVRRLVGGQKS